jgi:ribosome recycling factor
MYRAKIGILGGFYEEELQKVKHSDIYLVEKVLRKKEKKCMSSG